MPEWLQIFLTVLVTLAGREGLGLWNAKVQARKLAAQAESVEIDNRVRIDAVEWQRMRELVDAIQADNKLLREDNKLLREDLEQLKSRESVREDELNRLRLGIVVLIGQLRARGIEPAWEPK